MCVVECRPNYFQEDNLTFVIPGLFFNIELSFQQLYWFQHNYRKRNFVIDCLFRRAKNKLTTSSEINEYIFNFNIWILNWNIECWARTVKHRTVNIYFFVKKILCLKDYKIWFLLVIVHKSVGDKWKYLQGTIFSAKSVSSIL